MRFRCPSNELQRGTQIAVRAVPSRPTTVPILSNVLIQAAEDRVTLTCYDQEVGIQVTLPVTVDEPGEATAPAKLLADLMSDLPPSEITVNLEDRFTIKVNCGKSQFNLAGLPPEDFPLLPEVGQDLHLFIQAPVLREVIKQTLFGVCAEDSRPALTGVYFVVSEDTLTAVSTDTHRLCVRQVNMPGLRGDNQVILPSRALDQFVKAIPQDVDTTVDIRIARNYAQLKCEGITVISRLIEGPFPNYQRVLPAGFEKLMLLDREPLLRALKRVSVVARSDKAQRVVLKGEEGLLKLTSETTGLGRVYEEVMASLEGDDLELVFNCSYLTDVLSVLDQKQIRMEVSGKLTPCVIRAEGDDSYRYIVMPMSMS